MCDLLAFRRACAPRRRREPLLEDAFSGDAEIIIFPGVRYVRMPDPTELSKRPRASGRRGKVKKEDKPKKEKAS